VMPRNVLAHVAQVFEPLTQPKSARLLEQTSFAGRCEILVLLDKPRASSRHERCDGRARFARECVEIAMELFVMRVPKISETLSTDSRHSPSSQLRSKILWIGKWRLK